MIHTRFIRCTVFFLFSFRFCQPLAKTLMDHNLSANDLTCNPCAFPSAGLLSSCTLPTCCDVCCSVLTRPPFLMLMCLVVWTWKALVVYSQLSTHAVCERFRVQDLRGIPFFDSPVFPFIVTKRQHMEDIFTEDFFFCLLFSKQRFFTVTPLAFCSPTCNMVSLWVADRVS